MGQLKPRELRLVLFFFLTVLVLGSFFLYEWYAKSLGELKAENVNLMAERQSLLSMKLQQNDYNEKRVWLNQNQPISQDSRRSLRDRSASFGGATWRSADLRMCHFARVTTWALRR